MGCTKMEESICAMLFKRKKRFVCRYESGSWYLDMAALKNAGMRSGLYLASSSTTVANASTTTYRRICDCQKSDGVDFLHLLHAFKLCIVSCSW